MSVAPKPPQRSALRRMSGLFYRQWRLVAGSWPRILDLCYWPTMQITLWGFIQNHFQHQSGLGPATFGILLSAVVLWEMYFRSQNGFSLAFLEEIWSRHIGHLLVSPLRPTEMVLGMMAISFVKTMIGMVPAAFAAAYFFHTNVLDIGLPIVLFYLSLAMFGWTIGLLVAGLTVRFGQGAEFFAWAVVLLIAPLAAIYYPVSTLPIWLQYVAQALPVAHVFEGVRGVLETGRFDGGGMLVAFGLNFVWLALGYAVFLTLLAKARETGQLIQLGE